MALAPTTRRELLAAAAQILDRGILDSTSSPTELIRKGRDHGLLCGTEEAYKSCIKRAFRGGGTMGQLWAAVLANSRLPIGEDALQLSEETQEWLQAALRAGRAELVEVAGLLALARAAGDPRVRDRHLDAARGSLNKSLGLPANRGLSPAELRHSVAALSDGALDAAVEGWIQIVDACLGLAEPLTHGCRAVGIEAMERGHACERAYQRRRGSFVRYLRHLSTWFEGDSRNLWASRHAMLAMMDGQGPEEAVSIARGWAGSVLDDALSEGDVIDLFAECALWLCRHGRREEAASSSQQAWTRLGPKYPSTYLLDTCIELSGAFYAHGEVASAAACLPEAMRNHLAAPYPGDPEAGGWGADIIGYPFYLCLLDLCADPARAVEPLRGAWLESIGAAGRFTHPSAWIVAGCLAQATYATEDHRAAATVAGMSAAALPPPNTVQESRSRPVSER